MRSGVDFRMGFKHRTEECQLTGRSSFGSAILSLCQGDASLLRGVALDIQVRIRHGESQASNFFSPAPCSIGTRDVCALLKRDQDGFRVLLLLIQDWFKCGRKKERAL
jgi:hypothetical protein